MRGYAGTQDQTRFLFLCYRQVDGKEVAEWLYRHLHGRSLHESVGAESGELESFGQPTPCPGIPRLDVYFDQTAPAVPNWRDFHAPALERSSAMIVVCTPGLALDEGPRDEVQKEIGWWVRNRKTAPILIDPTESGARFVPAAVKSRWPEAQRLPLNLGWYESLNTDERSAFEQRVVQRICSGIALAEARHREEVIGQRTRQRTVFAVLALIACVGFGMALWQWSASERSEAEAHEAAGRARRLAYTAQIREAELRQTNGDASEALRVLQATDADLRGFEYEYLGGLLRPFDEVWHFGEGVLALCPNVAGELAGVVTRGAVWTRTASGFFKQPIGDEVRIESAEFLDHSGRQVLFVGVLDGKRGLWRTDGAVATRLEELAQADAGESLLAVDRSGRFAALVPKSGGHGDGSRPQLHVFDLEARDLTTERKSLELPESVGGYNSMTFDYAGEHVCLTEPLQGTGQFAGPVTMVRWTTEESQSAFDGMGVELLQDFPNLSEEGRCIYSVSFGRTLARWNEFGFHPLYTDRVDSEEDWSSSTEFGVRRGRPTVLRVLSISEQHSFDKMRLSLGNAEGILRLERVDSEGMVENVGNLALKGPVRVIASSADDVSLWAGTEDGEVVRVRRSVWHETGTDGLEHTSFLDESELEQVSADRRERLLPFRPLIDVFVRRGTSANDRRVASPLGRFSAKVVGGRLELFKGDETRASRVVPVSLGCRVLALSPDGDRALLGDELSHAVSLIELGTGRRREIQEAGRYADEDDYFVAAHPTHWTWSPDGARIAGGYNSLWMFEAQTGARICRLETSWSFEARFRNGPMTDVSFSPRGDMVGCYLSHSGFSRHGYLVWFLAPRATPVQVGLGQ